MKNIIPEGKSNTNKAISGSILYLFQIVVSSLLPLISIPIITHRIEPAEYGVFALAQVYGIIATGMVNWGMAAGYERNFFLYENEPNKAGALLHSVTTFVTCNVIILISIVWVWQSNLSSIIFDREDYGLILFLLVSGTGLSSIASYYLLYLKNFGKAIDYVKIMIFQSVSNFGLILFFLLHLNMGIASLAYAFFLSNALMFMVVAVQQFINLPAALSKPMLWDVLRISLPLTPRVFFGFLGTQFDKIMLGMMALLGGVGVYSIGQKVAGVIFQFMTALDLVFIPEVYRRLFAQENDKNPTDVGQYLTPFAYISILIAMGFVLFSEELFALAMPDSYAAGVDIIIVLSLYYASMFFGKITGTQLIYAKKTHITTALTFVGIALNVLLNIPMIIEWGAIGAAWATMIAGISVNILSYRIAQRYASVDWDWKSLLWIFGIFVGAALMMLLSRMFLAGDIYWGIFIVKLLFVIIYLYLGKVIGIVSVKNIQSLYLEGVSILRSKNKC